MPIVKHVNVVHDGNYKYLNNVFKYFEDEKKRPDSSVLNLFNYADNKDKVKSDDEFLSTLNGVSKDSTLAKEQFELVRLKRLSEKNITPETNRKDSRYLYHFVVSFNKEDTLTHDWKELHKFSESIAKEIAGDEYQAFMASHLPSSDYSNEYFHTHIIINAYSNKYKGNKLVLRDGYVQKLIVKANELAKEKGYGTVSDPIGYSRKDKSWYENFQYKNNKSWKEQLKIDILTAKKYSNTYEEFISMMKEWGYGIRDRNLENNKEYKTISFIPSKNNKEKKSVRGKTLGEEFSKDSLKKYFALSKEERNKTYKKEYEKLLRESEAKKYNNEKIYKQNILEINKDGNKIFLNKKDKFNRKKTNYEINLETEIELAKKRNEESSYLQKLYNDLKIVNQLKIENILDLEEKLKEKNIYLAQLYKERKNLEDNLESLKKEKTNSDLDDFEKDLLDLKVSNRSVELQDLNKKINDTKIYSKDLESISRTFEYKKSKYDIRNQAERNLNKYKRRKSLNDNLKNKSTR